MYEDVTPGGPKYPLPIFPKWLYLRYLWYNIKTRKLTLVQCVCIILLFYHIRYITTKISLCYPFIILPSLLHHRMLIFFCFQHDLFPPCLFFPSSLPPSLSSFLPFSFSFCLSLFHFVATHKMSGDLAYSFTFKHEVIASSVVSICGASPQGDQLASSRFHLGGGRSSGVVFLSC